MSEDLFCPATIDYARPDGINFTPIDTVDPHYDGMTMDLPGRTPSEAAAFLEGLGGDAAGAGYAMQRVGINAPLIRATYKKDIEGMVAEIVRRMEAGESKEAVARWASAERNRIVAKARKMSAPGVRSIYTIRDWRKYGFGGRTWSNMEAYNYKHYGVTGDAFHQRMVDGALKSDPNVNQGALKGAKYLKHGGRIIMVVGVAASAARIWNATDEELPRVIGEEIGCLVGGAVGGGLGVGACLIFGIASGGWGLLACGVVGGGIGGYAGSKAGGAVAEGIYYSDADTPEHLMGEVSIEIPVENLYLRPPPQMCIAPK